MKLGILRRIAALAIMALSAWLMIEPALAQAPTPPTPNKGDMAWMLTATVLVLLMTIPAWPCSTAAWCAPRTCCRC